MQKIISRKPCCLFIAFSLTALLWGCTQKTDEPEPQSQSARISIANLKVINATIATGLNTNSTSIFAGSDGTIIYQDQQWQAANTAGITQAINHLCTTENGKQIIAIGSDGLLASSENDGKTWKNLSSAPTSEALFECAFEAKSGYWLLSSENGAIFYSQDLNNWQQAQTPGALTRLYTLRNSGLLIATGPQLVAHSQDGGKHWQKIFSATATGVLDTNHQLMIIDDQGSVWRTLDLLHWNEIVVQPHSSLAAIAQDMEHKTLSLITSLGDIFVSDDEGMTWGISFSAGQPLTQLIYDATNKTLIAVGSGGIFYSDSGGRVWQKSTMDFNDQVTFLWATAREALAFGPGGLQAISIDGGKSWQLQRPAIASFIHQLKAAPDKSLLATGAEGLLLRSTDGGESWQHPQANISAQDFLFSLLMTNKQQFAAGSPGTILRSQNNGQGWQTRLALGDPNKGYFHKIISDDHTTLVALAGPGSTYLSTDAGDTWQPAQIDNSQHLLNGVFDKAHQQFIAVGNSGIIQRSSNGHEWSKTNSNTEVDLQGVATIGDMLFASGNQGTILRSLDGGKNWQQLSTHTNTAIQHMVAVQNDRVILAAGLNGLLLRSTDKGDNWQTVLLPETTNLREPVEDKRTGIIYLSSRAGNILFSRDAGATWGKLPQVTQESIKGIYIDDARRTLVGYGARLIRIPLLER